jgi:hypothetical protein
MSFSNANKMMSGAATAALIGLLTTPASAHARPDFECYSLGGYQFPGGDVVLHYPETDSETRFSTPKGLTVDAPAVTVFQSGVRLKGRVTGSIEKGGNIIRLKVTREGYEPLFLDGAVDADNTPAGSFAWENHDRQLWDSPTEFSCLPGSPPPVADQLPPAEELLRSQTATVAGGPVDVFNIAHNDIPDPVNGIAGAKIATLQDGAQVNLDGACKDGWCRVNEASIPQGFGFVEQGRLAF